MANFKKFDTDDAGPEENQPMEPVPAPPDLGSAYADDDVPRGTGKMGKIIAAGSVILIVVVLAVGIFMGIRYSKRFDKLQACSYQHMEGDFIKPEFVPCVRDVLNSSSFGDVKVAAIKYLVLAESRDSIPDLIKALDDGGEVMRQAAQGIAMLGGKEAQEARDPLVRAIEGGGPRDKVIMAWALAKLGDERAFRPLLDGYIDGYTRELEGWNDDFLVDYAASDPKALDEMIKLSDSDDEAHRWFAASTLGKMKSDAVIAPLLKLSKDPNKNVVQAAAISLGMTGTKEAGQAVLEVLNRYPEMTDDLLRSIQQSAGAPGLYQVYKQTEKPSIKSKIVAYIRDIKDPRSGDLLMAILENVEKETEGKGIKAGLKTRKEIALALSDIGDPRSLPLLKILINLDDVEAVCKLYDCGPVSDFNNLTDDQKEAYLRGYRLSPAMSDYIDGVTNVGDQEARQILLGMWKGIADLNKKYRGDAYLYWPCRPAEVMYALGRLNVDGVGPMLEGEVCSNAAANQRAISLNVGTKKDLTIPCPDIEAASKALGRAKYTPILEKFIDIAERPKDVDFSVPNVDNENIYSDRRVVLLGMAFLGDPGAIEPIETILDDVTDYIPTKDIAAEALPYVVTPEKHVEIIQKLQDATRDTWVRSWYARALIPMATPAISQPILSMLQADPPPPNPLITPLGVALGEGCNQEVLHQTLDFLEQASGPGSLTDSQSAALLAIIICGSDDTIAKTMRYLSAGDNEERLRMIYTAIPFYLTSTAFETGRVYGKLKTAYYLRKKDILWPWQYLMERMTAGYEDSPDGLSNYEMRTILYNEAKSGGENQEIAIKSLLGMGARGYVLALTREEGKVSKMAWDTLREWD